MKSKHAGLVGAALALAALLIVAGELLWATFHRAHPVTVGAAFDAYASDRFVIEPAALARMDLVEPTLASLVRPTAVAGENVIGAETAVDFAMFGQRPAATPVPAGPVRRAAVRTRQHPYRVVMTYVSGDHRYAVIDSKLYRQNATLPSGENLAEISAGAVRLDSPGGQRWIAVQGGAGR